MEAQRKLQEAEDARLKAQDIVTQRLTQQKTDREAAINALVTKLSPLLEVVGARDQLEEVKVIWKVGTIDPVPLVISESPTPSIGLALRHKHIRLGQNYDRGRNIWDNDTWVGQEPDKHTSSYLQLVEDAVFVVTGQEEDISTLQTYSGSKALTYTSFPGSYEGGAWEFQYFAQAQPEQFQINDPDYAKRLLENQLVHVLVGFKPSLDWQEKMETEIARDKFLSRPDAQGYYRSLMKSIGALQPQPENSVPWYKRLLT